MHAEITQISLHTCNHPPLQLLWPLCTSVVIAEDAQPIKEHKRRFCTRRLPIGLSPKRQCNRAANA